MRHESDREYSQKVTSSNVSKNGKFAKSVVGIKEECILKEIIIKYAKR